jgi:glycolate dehydrogenase FAD-binding subunit
LPNVFEPATPDAAAASLAECAARRQRVAIRGGGTKAGWTSALSADVTISTRAMNRIVAHRHGDLTATIEAGAVLDDVNRELARHGQWIPLDPAWTDRATIGGIVASNDSGPRRHRYGAPRDVIIGVEIARADGVRAKAGGIVVKNVAGYDVARLMTGSFGSLALITSVTFKLYPIPAASRTVAADLTSHIAAGALAAAINASQLTPTAVEIQSPPSRMLIRFESTPASVDAQSGAAVHLAESCGCSSRVIVGDEEQREWRAHGDRVWTGDGAVLKLTLLPSDLPAVLDAIESVSPAGCDVSGRAGLGVLLVRIEGDASVQSRAISALRARVPLARGAVVVLRRSDQLNAAVDPWGPMGDAERVMRAVKAAFDPAGVFSDLGGRSTPRQAR